MRKSKGPFGRTQSGQERTSPAPPRATLSARIGVGIGLVRPRDVSAFNLNTRSNGSAGSTNGSSGLAHIELLPMWPVARRQKSSVLAGQDVDHRSFARFGWSGAALTAGAKRTKRRRIGNDNTLPQGPGRHD